MQLPAVACAGSVLAVQWAVLAGAVGWPAALLSGREAEGVLRAADLSSASLGSEPLFLPQSLSASGPSLKEARTW